VSRRFSTKLCSIGDDHSWCRRSDLSSELIDTVISTSSVTFCSLSDRPLSSACFAVAATLCQRLLKVQGMMPCFLAIAERFLDSWELRSAIAFSIELIGAETSRVEVSLLLLIELHMMWVCVRCGKFF
jgi:hypothetical protein